MSWSKGPLGVRRWIGETFPEPADEDLQPYVLPMIPIGPHHGTEAGYAAHRAKKQAACPDCLHAHNIRNEERAAARKVPA